MLHYANCYQYSLQRGQKNDIVELWVNEQNSPEINAILSNIELYDLGLIGSFKHIKLGSKIEMQFQKFFLVLASLTLIASCGGGNDSSGVDGDVDDITSTSSDIESLVGVYAWDLSENGDEGYLVIAADGGLSEYDYMGDSFDMGPNCYTIDEDYGVLSHNSGTSYTVTVTDLDIELLVNIEITSDGFISSSTDSVDGEVSDRFFDSNLLVSDFTPECGGLARPATKSIVSLKGKY